MTSLLNIVLAACLISAPAAAAPIGDAPSPRTPTEAALACLLGLSHWLCQDDVFAMQAKRSARLPKTILNCVDEEDRKAWPKHPAFAPECPDGMLEAVDYLGTNARGDDVYAVRYRYGMATLVLQQPDPEGKVEKFWTIRGNPNGGVPSYMIVVPAQKARKIAVYRREQ